VRWNNVTVTSEAATDAALRILVVEDSPEDARAVTETLEASGQPVEVSVARRLDEAIPALAGHHFDAMLLDLTLPDSAGLETVVEMCGRAPDLAVVVVTRNADADLPARSLRAGAEDYVSKSDLQPRRLLRTVTNAIERHRHTVDELDHARALGALDAAPGHPSAPLAERDPELFDALTTRYADALEVALDRAAYRSSNRARDILGALAARLGTATATPRDVVDIHMRVITASQRQRHPERAAAYVDEGRLALVEVLGRLASWYRDRYLASAADAGAADRQREEPT
jgi:DNA-binding response OmpR family regulator